MAQTLVCFLLRLGEESGILSAEEVGSNVSGVRRTKQMVEKIQVQMMEDFSKIHPKERLYQLEVPVEPTNLPFGFLYINPELSTLIWRGSLDFSLLEQEALGRLPFVITSGWKKNGWIGPDMIKETALVSLILEAKELQVYKLMRLEQFLQYRRTLEIPTMISFARYDIVAPRMPIPLKYTFTAENPNWSYAQRSELTIQLPKWQYWSEDLLKWVIEHHVDANALKLEDYPGPVAKTISNLVLNSEEKGR